MQRNVSIKNKGKETPSVWFSGSLVVMVENHKISCSIPCGDKKHYVIVLALVHRVTWYLLLVGVAEIPWN